jgi:hypothetical protein
LEDQPSQQNRVSFDGFEYFIKYERVLGKSY